MSSKSSINDQGGIELSCTLEMPAPPTDIISVCASDVPARSIRAVARICCVPCWRYHLPYGKWTCADGTEVLFNRQYHPMWTRKDGRTQKVEYFWVHFKKEEHFFNDGDTPWASRNGMKSRKAFWRCVKVLKEFGVEVDYLESVPAWVHTGRHRGEDLSEFDSYALKAKANS